MNADFGTNAQALRRKRVSYEGTNTIYEGMLLSYNHDATANILGWDKGNSQVGSTTAEGNQNEGKFKLVEEPSLANQNFVAGVVAGASEAGKVGPRWLDIYVPNGAIVAVRTNKSVSINDKAYLDPGLNTVSNEGVNGGPVIGVFIETVDRSSVAGLALCKLTGPNVADYSAASTLGVGYSPALWGDCPIDAIKSDPGKGIIYEDDFLGAANLVSTEGWTITQVTTGTLSLVASVGGELKADSAGNTTADDGVQAQLLGCRFLPAAGTNIWFEARVKMNDATDQYFIGLAATDTTLIASGVLDDASDKVGFYHEAASTDDKISSVTARTTADDKTADVADNADGTYMTVGFKITGLTSVEFYVDGVLVETGVTVANIPNAAMCLSLCAQIEGTGADAELSVDWVRIAQDVARA